MLSSATMKGNQRPASCSQPVVNPTASAFYTLKNTTTLLFPSSIGTTTPYNHVSPGNFPTSTAP